MAVLLATTIVNPPSIVFTRTNLHISGDLLTFGDGTAGSLLFPHKAFDSSVFTPYTTYSKTSPITTITKTINIGDFVSASYLEDFYFRVHKNYIELDLGNILSEQKYTLYLWNGFFSNITLNSITEDSLNNVSLSYPDLVPDTYSPLEYTTSEVTISPNGAPFEDGYFYFTFDVQVVSLHIFGRRVAIWPFPPQRVFTESKEWKTDVIKTYTTESRYAVREYPRVTYQYKNIFRTAREYSMARDIAKKIIAFVMGLPTWDQITFVGDISAGTSTIYLDTSFMEFDSQDSVLFIYESYDNTEIVEILNITSSSISFINPTTKNLQNCWVAPIKIGYGSKIDFTRGPNAPQADVNMTATYGYNLVDWTPDTYQTLPVLDTLPISTGNLRGTSTINKNTFDSEVGQLVQFNNEDTAKLGDTIRFAAHTREQKYTLKRKLDYFKGKYQTFWLPTFNKDVEALSDILSASTTLLIKHINWTIYAPKYIMVIGTITEYFEILSVVDNGNGTETLNLDHAPGQDVTSIQKVHVLLKVRLDSDNLEYSYDKGGNMFITLPVKEII